MSKKDDDYLMNMLRQGNLVGSLMKGGIVAFPAIDDDEGRYSSDTTILSIEDPIKEGNTLTFTLRTEKWVSA